MGTALVGLFTQMTGSTNLGNFHFGTDFCDWIGFIPLCGKREPSKKIKYFEKNDFLEKAVQFCTAFLHQLDEKNKKSLQIIDRRYELYYNILNTLCDEYFYFRW